MNFTANVICHQRLKLPQLNRIAVTTGVIVATIAETVAENAVVKATGVIVAGDAMIRTVVAVPVVALRVVRADKAVVVNVADRAEVNVVVRAEARGRAVAEAKVVAHAKDSKNIGRHTRHVL